MKILITGATGFGGGRFLEAFGQQYGLENVVGTGRNIEQIQAKIKKIRVHLRNPLNPFSHCITFSVFSHQI